MVLRIFICLTLALNPLAEVRAENSSNTPSSTKPKLKNSTILAQPDAPDWFVEALYHRKKGNMKRAKELLEAARSKLGTEALPEPYASQIQMRLDTYIASVGGSTSDSDSTNNRTNSGDINGSAANNNTNSNGTSNGHQPRSNAPTNGVPANNAPANSANGAATNNPANSPANNFFPNNDPTNDFPANNGRNSGLPTENAPSAGTNNKIPPRKPKVPDSHASNASMMADQATVAEASGGKAQPANGKAAGAADKPVPAPMANSNPTGSVSDFTFDFGNDDSKGTKSDPFATNTGNSSDVDTTVNTLGPADKPEEPPAQNANAKVRGEYLIATGDPQILKDTLGSDDEARALLWWIAAGRAARNAQPDRLKEIIKRDLNTEDLNSLDSFNSGFGGFGGFGSEISTGMIGDLLSTFGILDKDYNAEARMLMQVFDGSKLDELAYKYIEEAAKYGALYGGAFGMWRGLRELGPTASKNNDTFGGFDSSGTQTDSNMQIYSDLIVMFLNNSDYLMKIAALYGIKLDQIQKQFIGLFVFAVAKTAAKKVRTRKPPGSGTEVPGEETETGSIISHISGSMGSTLRMAGRAFGMANRDGRGEEFLAKRVADMAGDAGPVIDVTDIPDVNAPPAGTPPAGGSTTGGSDTGGTTNPDGGDADKDKDGKDKGDKPKRKRNPSPRRPNLRRMILNTARVAKSTAQGAVLGGSEAALIAAFAKYFFQGMYEDNVRLQNKAFIRVLNSDKGMAFLKLLVHSMNLGEESISRFTADRAKSEKVAFILNLARAAGICSSDDFKLLEQHPTVKVTDSQEVKAARFSCPMKTNPYAYNTLMREMMTFSALPDRTIAHLRASTIRDRLKMAQLMIQFLHLEDGVMTRDEKDFFEEVSSKILGITSDEQRNYLNIFTGYVRQAGMVLNPLSPTGFGIGHAKEGLTNPYDLKTSPTPSDAPPEVLAVDWDDGSSNESNSFSMGK